MIEDSRTSLLGTYSNANKGGYSQKGFSLTAWTGHTVTLRFRVTTFAPDVRKV